MQCSGRDGEAVEPPLGSVLRVDVPGGLARSPARRLRIACGEDRRFAPCSASTAVTARLGALRDACGMPS